MCNYRYTCMMNVKVEHLNYVKDNFRSLHVSETLAIIPRPTIEFNV